MSVSSLYLVTNILRGNESFNQLINSDYIEYTELYAKQDLDYVNYEFYQFIDL